MHIEIEPFINIYLKNTNTYFIQKSRQHHSSERNCHIYSLIAFMVDNLIACKFY
jgi:hypothetical protein